LIARDALLDRLVPPSGACLGAACLSYSFDARFFEEEYLAAVLRIGSDPVEDEARFLAEGRRAVQETPVVVIVDPGHFRGGRRLPYDLVLASDRRTFHPKLSLLLFADHARLALGSANLTEGGFGGNAELNVIFQVDYSDGVTTLRAVVDFFRACGVRGEAWERFERQLLLLAPELSDADASPELLHTAAGAASMLDQFLARIPDDERVRRLGVLAPFHQEDGAQPEFTVIDRLLDGLRTPRGKRPKLDLGLSWDGNPLTPPERDSDESLPLWECEGRLFGWTEGGSEEANTSWFVLGRHEGHGYWCESAGPSIWRTTRALNTAIAARRCWPIAEVPLAGPDSIIRRLIKRSAASLWGFPEARLESGRVYRPPLHGKLLAVVPSHGRRRQPHLLVGSPNASRRALLDPNGTVECAMHLRMDGAHTLSDLCPGLVPVPADIAVLYDREFPDVAPNPARFVEDAIYDAAERRLTVTWTERAPRLELLYPIPGSALSLFVGRPSGPLEVDDFNLMPTCAELSVSKGEVEGRVPIRVVHIVDLGTTGMTNSLTLEELVGLHAGRYSAEGLSNLRAGSSAAADAAVDPGTVLSLRPREIFRAFFSIAKELGDPEATLGSFEVQLLGRAGVAELLDRILEGPESGSLGSEEAWFYGQELRRCLLVLDLGKGPVQHAKQDLLDEFLRGRAKRLKRLAPRGKANGAIRRFYARSPR